jgi:long-subunit acyl-CoA synthetase (AMP-forming)
MSTFITPERAVLYRSAQSSILDLLWAARTTPSIHDPSTGKSLAHDALFRTVRDFRLPPPRDQNSKPVVGILLPNGPLLGISVIAVANRYTAAPINASSGPDQIKADVLQAGANIVLATPGDVQKLGLEDAWVAEAGITVVSAELSEDMGIRLSHVDDVATTHNCHVPNIASDIAIILFTSGTSGTKKLVPLSIKSILAGVRCVIESWGLTETDVCNNLMPLNHV